MQLQIKKGATLGIASKSSSRELRLSPGKGITIKSENKSLSSRLINKTIEKIVSKKDLEQNKISDYIRIRNPYRLRT